MEWTAPTRWKTIAPSARSWRGKQELAERPEIICVSKAELPDAAEVQASLAAETGREVLLLSAVTGTGLNELVRRVDEALKSTEV